MTSLFSPAPEPPTELGRYRVLSKTAGIKVSPLQLGAMSIGNAWEGFMGSMDKDQSFKLLDAFYAAGGTTIDTANLYQDEDSETWIGEWMAKHQNRDDMVIATKYTSPYTAYRAGKLHAVNHAGNNKRSMHMSLRDSLKKLQTDYIDIFYLHVWDHTVSIEEIMDSLDALVKSGKVLYLGISDTPAWVVAACNTYARDHGKTPFSIYQGKWNVMTRDLERDIIPMCQHFGMAIAPWDVLGGGKLQSKKSLEERKKNNEGMRNMGGGGRSTDQTEQEIKMSEALLKVAEEHGIESVTAIALAYVISKAPQVYPIIGGRKVEHLKDNIQALKIKLSQEQIEYLESIVPLDVGFPNNFIGPHPQDTGTYSGIIGNTAPHAFALREKSILHK